MKKEPFFSNSQKYSLEPQRAVLKSAETKNLESDLFYLFNNLDIRHNNSDPESWPKVQAGGF